jgi:transcriptional regulator with XRE-family HTH domain
LAKKANITQSIVSELEDGDYNPTVDVLNRIANALGIKIDLLAKENFNRRFFETLDYFVSKIKGVDILKLMKLMFFADLDAYNVF